MNTTKTNPTSRPRRPSLQIGQAVLLATALTASAAAAQQAPPPPSWTVKVGVGAASTSIYPGASERYVVPFPTIEASWTRGTMEVSASVLNGLGMTYFQQSTGLIWNVSVSPGGERLRDSYSVMGVRVDHPDQVRALLQNTANAVTPVSATAMVAVPTPVGLLGASAGYAPTKVSYAEAGSRDEVRHGAHFSLVYLMGMPLSERLSFAATAQLKYMNDGYAGAWYAVEQDTPSLPAFAAGSGWQNTQAALQLDYRLTDRMDVSFLGAGTWLLGDARKSPFTQAKRSHDLVLQLFYRL